MRALRDFNIPKIITDDVPVFMGLIGDLFPALDVPRKRDMEFERTVKQAAMDLLLQPEDNFILKVILLTMLIFNTLKPYVLFELVLLEVKLILFIVLPFLVFASITFMIRNMREFWLQNVCAWWVSQISTKVNRNSIDIY